MIGIEEQQQNDPIASDGEYWCHECGCKTVARVRQSDQSVYCSRCNSEFVELLENDGSLYQQPSHHQEPSAPPQDEDLMLDSIIDDLLSGNSNEDNTNNNTAHEQQEQPNELPRPSANLNPILQQLFGNANMVTAGAQQQQQQQQQVPNLGT